MNSEELQQLLGKMRKSSSVTEPPSETREVVPEFELDDDGEEYTGVGINGVLASTEKLKAVNKGLIEPDERDSLRYQKIFMPHSMARESIKMDAGKLGRQALYQAVRRRNLSGLGTAPFEGYMERLLVGNPLTSPLEEINPMQLVENARRITKMGPGGLGSSRSITNEAQAVHPSQFGFISGIEGPESERAGIDVRAAYGVHVGNNGRLYQIVRDRKTGKLRWVSPKDLDGATTKIPD